MTQDTPSTDTETKNLAITDMESVSDPDCVFCKIVAGKIPSTKLYEDKHVIAFLDIAPNNPGHTLVIPKDHFENIYTLPPETWCYVTLAAQKLAVAVRNGMDADGINIAMNNESTAGQEVSHAHVHVIPRFVGDGFAHGKHKEYKDQDEMNTIAENIKKALN